MNSITKFPKHFPCVPDAIILRQKCIPKELAFIILNCLSNTQDAAALGRVSHSWNQIYLASERLKLAEKISMAGLNLSKAWIGAHAEYPKVSSKIEKHYMHLKNQLLACDRNQFCLEWLGHSIDNLPDYKMRSKLFSNIAESYPLEKESCLSKEPMVLGVEAIWYELTAQRLIKNDEESYLFALVCTLCIMNEAIFNERLKEIYDGFLKQQYPVHTLYTCLSTVATFPDVLLYKKVSVVCELHTRLQSKSIDTEGIEIMIKILQDIDLFQAKASERQKCIRRMSACFVSNDLDRIYYNQLLKINDMHKALEIISYISVVNCDVIKRVINRMSVNFECLSDLVECAMSIGGNAFPVIQDKVCSFIKEACREDGMIPIEFVLKSARGLFSKKSDMLLAIDLILFAGLTDLKFINMVIDTYPVTPDCLASLKTLGLRLRDLGNIDEYKKIKELIDVKMEF